MFDYLEKNSSALIQRWLTTTDSYYIQMRAHTHTQNSNLPPFDRDNCESK